MNYSLDTCVISELIKKLPNNKVTKWIQKTEEKFFFISVLTFGEIQKGIEKLSKSKKKEKLHYWVNNELTERFKNRIIPFDLHTASIWGKIQAQSEIAGKCMPAIDGQIAATAISNNLVVVTRNTKDIEISGVPLFNPWE